MRDGCYTKKIQSLRVLEELYQCSVSIRRKKGGVGEGTLVAVFEVS